MGQGGVQSGVQMMMSRLGLDPAEMMKHVETFTADMKSAASAINANQQRIETKLDAIDAKLADLAGRADAGGFSQPAPATTELLDVDGKPTNVLITSERFPQAMIDDVNARAEERSAGEA